MIKYEFKKVSYAVWYIVLGMAFVVMIISTILFMKNASTDVSMNAKYYSETTEYSEQEYNILLEQRTLIYNRYAAEENKTIKEQIRTEMHEVNAKIDIYRNIYNRRFNMQVFTTYKNWESSLKYYYDINESYSIVNTTMWNAFFKYPLYEYVALITIIILVIVVYTSDNREGNRKVLYATHKGILSVKANKRKLTYIGTITITSICLLGQLIVSICMGLDIGILDIGLYQLDDFPFASSHICIGEYLLYMVFGHIVFNLMIVAFIDMLTCLIDKKIFVTILSGLYLVLLGIYSEGMWINPITMLDTSYYFDNVREVTIGNFVFYQYLISVVVIGLLVLLFGMVAKLIQMLKVEIE